MNRAQLINAVQAFGETAPEKWGNAELRVRLRELQDGGVRRDGGHPGIEDSLGDRNRTAQQGATQEGHAKGVCHKGLRPDSPRDGDHRSDGDQGPGPEPPLCHSGVLRPGCGRLWPACGDDVRGTVQRASQLRRLGDSKTPRESRSPAKAAPPGEMVASSPRRSSASRTSSTCTWESSPRARAREARHQEAAWISLDKGTSQSHLQEHELNPRGQDDQDDGESDGGDSGADREYGPPPAGLGGHEGRAPPEDGQVKLDLCRSYVKPWACQVTASRASSVRAMGW